MRQSIGDLMRERVFVPLGMTRTSMVWEPYFAADMANGYDEAGSRWGTMPGVGLARLVPWTATCAMSLFSPVRCSVATA